jgi:hypothetical protein
VEPSVLSNISTPQDLKALTIEVQRYARWFAQASIKSRVSGAATAETLAISEAAVKLIKDTAGIKPLDQNMLDNLVVSLQALEASTPHVTITLAAAPGSKLKSTLVEWCRKNIEPNILINFKFNATILGGMVVQYGSHVHDWSFKRQIMAARGKFPEVLRRV